MGWMRRVLVLAAVALGAVAVGGVAVTVPGAGAADTKVKPILECVFPLEEGGYVALFGYENQSKVVVDVPISNDNKITPKPDDRGQPTSFEPGRVVGAFTVEVPGNTAIVWHLTGSVANANKNSKQCEKPPVPVGTGSAQGFVWLAVAAGAVLVVGGGGGSAWILRRRRRA
jgi:hypothetical protein